MTLSWQLFIIHLLSFSSSPIQKNLTHDNTIGENSKNNTHYHTKRSIHLNASENPRHGPTQVHQTSQETKLPSTLTPEILPDLRHPRRQKNQMLRSVESFKDKTINLPAEQSGRQGKVHTRSDPSGNRERLGVVIDTAHQDQSLDQKKREFAERREGELLVETVGEGDRVAHDF